RLPKAAQIFTAWCVRADMGEFCVFLGHLAVEVAAISRRQVTGSGDHDSLPFNKSRGWRAWAGTGPSVRPMCPLCSLAVNAGFYDPIVVLLCADPSARLAQHGKDKRRRTH